VALRIIEERATLADRMAESRAAARRWMVRVPVSTKFQTAKS